MVYCSVYDFILLLYGHISNILAPMYLSHNTILHANVIHIIEYYTLPLCISKPPTAFSTCAVHVRESFYLVFH